jgi:ribosome-binding factor A
MAQAFSRARRVGEQIKRELAQLIRSESDDPRLTMVSITGVDVSRDLAYAKVYVTLLGAPEARPEVVAELNRLTPLLRKQLGRLMRIRSVPHLTFTYDEVVERGAELSALIDRAVAADAEKHKQPDD